MNRNVLSGPRVVAVVAAMALGGVNAPQAQRPVATLQGGGPGESELQVMHVRGPVYVLGGAGGNVVASVGADGVLLVDTGSREHGDRVVAAVQALQRHHTTSGVAPLAYGALTRSSLERLRVTPAPAKPTRFILNTSAHPDHAGGNERVAAAGQTFTGHNVAGDLGLSNVEPGATVYAHENVMLRMIRTDGDRPEAPPGALPRLTYRSEYYKLQPHFNGEGIQLIHRPAAMTDGDSLVWFRGSDVIATGDIFSTTSYPLIDVERGGSIQGEIDALNAVLDLAFPEYIHQGGTLIIPGHGRVSDHADAAAYRDMVTIVRDRIRDLIGKGMTLEQIKAEQPTADYDPRYARGPAAWTADRFVEVVFRSLTAHRN